MQINANGHCTTRHKILRISQLSGLINWANVFPFDFSFAHFEIGRFWSLAHLPITIDFLPSGFSFGQFLLTSRSFVLVISFHLALVLSIFCPLHSHFRSLISISHPFSPKSPQISFYPEQITNKPAFDRTKKMVVKCTCATYVKLDLLKQAMLFELIVKRLCWRLYISSFNIYSIEYRSFKCTFG